MLVSLDVLEVKVDPGLIDIGRQETYLKLRLFLAINVDNFDRIVI